MVRKIKLPIIERKNIAEKTWEISFGLSGQNPSASSGQDPLADSERGFNFLAGQYIRVSPPQLLYPDPKGASRLFSIASSPNDKEKISTAFRDSGSGFKQTLIKLPISSLVDIEGPFGYFTLPKNSSQPIVLIAGGIGITPCLSMIRFAGEQKLNHPITLLYTNKNEAGAAYLKELTAITQKNSNFLLKKRYNRIDADFIRQSVDNLGEQIWYVVGLPSMVAGARNILSDLGIENTKIYSEDFTGYE